MDIVADACAIRCIVIITEYAQARQFSDRHLRDVWHQVVRDAGRVFADQAGFMRADRVEITQQGDAPLGIGECHVLQDLFDHHFCVAVRVRCACRQVFRQR